MSQIPPPIPPFQQNTQPVIPIQTTNQKSNHTLAYILIIAVGLIVFIIFGTLIYFNQASKMEITNYLPVSIDNPNLKRIELLYSFDGNLTEIKPTPEGTQLITDIKGKGIPDFILRSSKPSRILIKNLDGGVFEVGKVQDLKKGNRLLLNSVYDIKSKEWSLPIVRVINAEFNSPPNPSSASADLLL